MIDTHCHLTSPQFTEGGLGRVDQVIADARAAGVRAAITVATTSADALAARDLAHRHANLWFTAGIHPLNCDEPIDWDDLRAAAADPKCVAWGELGLDNHYPDPPRALQDRILEEQLAFVQGMEASRQKEAVGNRQWAMGNTRAQGPMPNVSPSPSPIASSRPIAHCPLPNASARPIVVHCRDAFDELLAVFRAAPFDPARYVFHCFTGGPNEARKVLDFGAWISFTGVVTFHNAPEVAAAAKLVPADRIMAETDSPFLSPEPVRKVRPNEPKHVVHIVKKLAELRGVDPTEFERTLDANAKRFFGIDF